MNGVLRISCAVARHPSLWTVALRQGARLIPPRWWARPPFLPVPDRDYLRFRSLTQYGDPDRPAEPDDVLNYLRWCSEWDRHG